MIKTIGILGCGWLGLPLAIRLQQQGFTVKGTTRATEKLAVLLAEKILPYQVELTAEGISGAFQDFLEDIDVLIIDIPPGIRANENQDFVAAINHSLPWIVKAGVKQLLFVSSTSVFKDENQTITDETLPNPASASGKQLHIIEQLLLQNTNFQTTIVRFGGLIGVDRHPVHFLAGRKNLANPEAAINLIHLEDCIGVIQTIIEKAYWGYAINAVYPDHPSRQAYYKAKAETLNIDPPAFDSQTPSIGKKVWSNTLLDTLDYKFKQPI